MGHGWGGKRTIAGKGGRVRNVVWEGAGGLTSHRVWSVSKWGCLLYWPDKKKMTKLSIAPTGGR